MLNFVDSQLATWPLARTNYQALGKTERHSFEIGDLTVGIQCNPARIVSTGAKIDAATLAKRPCFLCAENRPPEQVPLEIVEGWELLLNPYPIFPTHFTIVSAKHCPQEGFPLEMVDMAEKLKGMTIFFNGSKAGASCPDHKHCQAVMTHELPLMLLVERSHRLSLSDSGAKHVATPEELGIDAPFRFVSVIITPDVNGMENLAKIEETIGKKCIEEGLVNIFVWIDSEGLLRIVGVPRKAHRPSCYGSDADQFLVSPGCIDMAGVIITPRREDFDRLTLADVRRIYSEVAF